MDKRQHILEVAEDMFAKMGFDGTSVRELAKAADVNVAMVSYYFGSKEKLFQEIIERGANVIYEQLLVLNQSQTIGSFQKVESLIDMYIERFHRNSNFHRIIHREIYLEQRDGLHAIIVGAFDKNLEEMQKILLEGQKKNEFKKVDIDMVLNTLIGTMQHAFRKLEFKQKLNNLPPVTDEEMVKFKKKLKKHLSEMLKAYLEVKSN